MTKTCKNCGHYEDWHKFVKPPACDYDNCPCKEFKPEDEIHPQQKKWVKEIMKKDIKIQGGRKYGKHSIPKPQKGKAESNDSYTNSNSEKPQKGSLPKRFHKEGLRKTRDGYVEIYSPHHPNQNKNKCVLEHRLVMEKHLGRFLTKKEVVHHINNNRKDNTIENLELFSSVGKHTQTHYIVRDKNGKFTKHGK